MTKCKICGNPVYFGSLYHPDCVDMELEKLREEIEGLKNTCDQWNDAFGSLYLSNQRLGEAVKAYSTAEAEGRLLVLPCKVGDTVYALGGDEGGEWIDEYKVKYFYCSSQGINRIYCTCGTMAKNFRPKDFGKTVFFTEQEAEAALKN